MNNIPYNTSLICPHCSVRAQFNIVFPRLSKGDQEETVKNIKDASNKGHYCSYSYSILRCQHCKRLVFQCIRLPKTGDSTVVGQFPSTVTAESDLRGCVPKEIFVDFESAIKCYEFGEYRPAAAMCRRSLQGSVLEQGASSNKKLIDQIDELNQNYPDRFTNDIKDWANRIRIFGNWGAHPDKDGLKDVNETVAREVIDFLKFYFQYVYLLPKKVADARVGQKSRKKT